jgi:phosphoglycolate phosphatase-like HAD superfamily hydrolase
MADELTAIVFDLDGTLLDLGLGGVIESVRERIRQYFEARGVRRSFRPILSQIDEAAAEVAARDGADPEPLVREARAFIDDAELEAGRSARPRPGAVRVIGALARAGVALAVVTDQGRPCVETALKAAGFDPATFGAISTRDDVPEPKPAPEGIINVLGALGIPSGKRVACLYLGDSESDIRAGKAAAALLAPDLVSLRVLGVLGGRAGREALEGLGAENLLDPIDGLLDLPLVRVALRRAM